MKELGVDLSKYSIPIVRPDPLQEGDLWYDAGDGKFYIYHKGEVRQVIKADPENKLDKAIKLMYVEEDSKRGTEWRLRNNSGSHERSSHKEPTVTAEDRYPDNRGYNRGTGE